MKWNILFLKTTFVSLKNPQQELWQTYQNPQQVVGSADYYRYADTTGGNIPLGTGITTGLLQPPELQNWTIGYSNVVSDLNLSGDNLILSANNINISCNRLFINGIEYDPNNIFNNSNKKT
jgi:hypothetical protein